MHLVGTKNMLGVAYFMVSRKRTLANVYRAWPRQSQDAICMRDMVSSLN